MFQVACAECWYEICRICSDPATLRQRRFRHMIYGRTLLNEKGDDDGDDYDDDDGNETDNPDAIRRRAYMRLMGIQQSLVRYFRVKKMDTRGEGGGGGLKVIVVDADNKANFMNESDFSHGNINDILLGCFMIWKSISAILALQDSADYETFRTLFARVLGYVSISFPESEYEDSQNRRRGESAQISRKFSAPSYAQTSPLYIGKSDYDLTPFLPTRALHRLLHILVLGKPVPSALRDGDANTNDTAFRREDGFDYSQRLDDDDDSSHELMGAFMLWLTHYVDPSGSLEDEMKAWQRLMCHYNVKGYFQRIPDSNDDNTNFAADAASVAPPASFLGDDEESFSLHQQRQRRRRQLLSSTCILEDQLVMLYFLDAVWIKDSNEFAHREGSNKNMRSGGGGHTQPQFRQKVRFIWESVARTTLENSTKTTSSSGKKSKTSSSSISDSAPYATELPPYRVVPVGEWTRMTDIGAVEYTNTYMQLLAAIVYSRLNGMDSSERGVHVFEHYRSQALKWVNYAVVSKPKQSLNYVGAGTFSPQQETMNDERYGVVRGNDGDDGDDDNINERNYGIGWDSARMVIKSMRYELVDYHKRQASHRRAYQEECTESFKSTSAMFAWIVENVQDNDIGLLLGEPF